ncbi:MAG TPA: phosphoglycerate kinase [Candidatus Limnocylindria bacterium]|nr:phosphoglycerate kinase [Candidatus Limnocylindria bacterium]
MAFGKKTVRDVDVKGKRVLVRAPLNVPISDGKVTDKMRLEAVVPTLKYLLDHGASLVLMSHHSKEGVSLEPVVPVLSELLDREVRFLPDCQDAQCRQDVQGLRPGGVVVLENLRFHPEEEINDDAFAKSLAELGDIYVDDDFTVMHREHASVVGVPKYLPAVAGFLVEEEVTTITKALEDPMRPLTAIVGGAKVSTKIELLDNLLPKVNAILIGGAMANTFLAAQGKSVGKSLQEPDQADLARRIMKGAAGKGIDLFLPLDVVVTEDIDTPKNVRTVGTDEVSANDIIVDVGPKTIALLEPVLAQKGTVIWNGPMGIAEKTEFANGSHVLAHAIIASGSASLIGGGDTAAFVEMAGIKDKFGFVSTGGGASLQLMSGQALPGLQALQNK